MSTYHAVVWIDHTEAHVIFFDKTHSESHRIQSRSHHKHQGKSLDMNALFREVAQALAECQEILLAGPGLVRFQLSAWCQQHAKHVAAHMVESVASDHPSDAQLVAMAKTYFKKFDTMAADPSLSH